MKCENANHVCDKKQYREATFFERIKLTLHLIYCSACRRYSANNNKLTKALNKSGFKTLASKDKLILKQRLREEMSR